MKRILAAVCGLVLVAVAAVAVAFQHDLKAADRRVAGAASIATALGPVEYAELGHGPPVLVIHGAAGGFDQGLDMAGPLAARGYRLIAPSRFGYLGSPAPAWAGPDLQSEAYVALLDGLKVEKVDIVAISAGAWSALAFATRHPERCRRLILLVPAAPLPPGARIHGGALAEAVFKSDFVAWGAVRLTPLAPGALSRVMLGVEPRVLAAASPQEKARIHTILEHLAPMGRRRTGMTLDIQTAARPPALDLSALRCPVLAISAEDDAFGTAARARQIAAGAPDARTLVFPTGGHALVGRLDAALDAADAFLRAP